jgi:hypothetical protein
MTIIKSPPGSVRAARGLFNSSRSFGLNGRALESRPAQIRLAILNTQPTDPSTNLILILLYLERVPQFPPGLDTVAMAK